jgi:Ras-related C3 botulinum toxin substrate 1
LALFDTAGQEDYDRLRPLSYPGTDVFILCYSTVNEGSFDNIEYKWYPEIKYHTSNKPHILVGTKMDLRDSKEYKENKRNSETLVTTEKGELMKKKLGSYSFRECSAKKNKNVKEVFDDAMRGAIFGWKNNENIKKKNCLIL